MPKAKAVDCVIISCPEWFEREDFLAWRRKENGPAVWKRETDNTEYGDVFITFEGPFWDDDEDCWRWEGSDSDLPRDIYNEIATILADLDKKGMLMNQYGTIWLNPCSGSVEG